MLLRGSGSAADLEDEAFSDGTLQTSGFPMAKFPPVREQYASSSGALPTPPELTFPAQSAHPALFSPPASIAISIDERKGFEQSLRPCICFFSFLLVGWFMLVLSQGGLWTFLLMGLSAPPSPPRPPSSPPPPPYTHSKLWMPQLPEAEEVAADFGKWRRLLLDELNDERLEEEPVEDLHAVE